MIKEILSKKLNNEMYQAIYSFSSRSTLPLVVRESISTASLIGTIKECIWLIFTVMQFMLQILLLLERFSGVRITSKETAFQSVVNFGKLNSKVSNSDEYIKMTNSYLA